VTSIDRRSFLRGTAAAAAVLPLLKVLPAHGNGAVLVIASGQTVNSLDLHRTGTNRAS
jgi:peptide/nickel transport system substrate-binding protein